MTDGPFKNAALLGRWKKFGNAADNDATSPSELIERAERALSKDLPKEFRALVHDLARFAAEESHGKPRVSINEVFERHSMSPLSDTLKRFLTPDLERPIELKTALDRALDNTIRKEQNSIRSRLIEESMHARERKDLVANRYSTVVRRLENAINSVNISSLREDVLRNKTAPRLAFAKQTGIDDGPSI